MKTPMQELIDRIKQLKYSETNEQAWDAYNTLMDLAESLLEKEKEQIMDAYTAGESDGEHYQDSYLRYYNIKYGVNK
jgi:hypothetical protein